GEVGVLPFSFIKLSSSTAAVSRQFFMIFRPGLRLSLGANAGPVAPTGPVGPVAPTGPAGPVAPTGPAGPVGPTGPAGPCEPVASGGPAGSATTLATDGCDTSSSARRAIASVCSAMCLL